MSLAVALVLLRLKRRQLDGTTLIAPFRWSSFCLLILATVIVVRANTQLSASTMDAMEYTATTATFCPLMAILGAKRPQNNGWQFIVVTLWIVFALPVVEMIVLWRGGELDEGPARQWFLVILLLVGFGNYMLTRFCVPALSVTVGQALLLLPHLPVASTHWPPHFDAGIGCIAFGIVMAWLLAKPSNKHSWDGVWTDFRDAFGLVWSLRVMDRINATAKLANWQSSLTWYGFFPPDMDDAGEQQQIERALRTLLRRFVSESWIEIRSP